MLVGFSVAVRGLQEGLILFSPGPPTDRQETAQLGQRVHYSFSSCDPWEPLGLFVHTCTAQQQHDLCQPVCCILMNTSRYESRTGTYELQV